MKKLLLTFIFLIPAFLAMTQSSINAGGNEGTSGSGSVTYSIGMPFYKEASGNGFTAGSGIQQSAEFLVLPVELLSFTVRLDNEQVAINWQTISEINSDYFIVEKSQDSKEWIKLDKISAAGQSSTLQEYSTMDENVEVGITYYRLKQVDLDGTYEYSSIESVKVVESQNTTALIYPNPTTDYLYVKLNDIDNTNCQYEIYCLTGEKVKSGLLENNTIMMSDLNTGTYAIRITLANQIILNSLIIKE